MKLIVFDTEATDLVPGQICQLSYLMVENGSITGKNMFFAVDEMSAGAQAVHGMSIEDLDELSGGERFADRAQEIFEDFCSADRLVGHNVSADDKYIRVEFERLGMKLPKIKTFCTMNYFTCVVNLKRRINTGHPKPPRLEELVGFYQLTTEQVAEKAAQWFGGGGAAHDARYDAAATYLCLEAGTRKGDLRGMLQI